MPEETRYLGMGVVACPSCGTVMKTGLLVAESFLGGAKWVRERTRLALGGERLVKPDGLGNVYVEGHRCGPCRLMILRY